MRFAVQEVCLFMSVNRMAKIQMDHRRVILNNVLLLCFIIAEALLV